MAIRVGSRIPYVEFLTMGRDGPLLITSEEVFRGRSVVLFAVPGAFTPSCHYVHMPSYLDEYETLRRAGVDTIACTAVNDPFVLDVWAQATGAKDKILFLADGNGDFVEAMDLPFDGRHLGLGSRSRRYALWAFDGVVRVLNIERDPTKAEVTTAYAMLRMFETWNAAP
jgi:glutaredoxin/glutathione-dependent peroxiredoxin